MSIPRSRLWPVLLAVTLAVMAIGGVGVALAIDSSEQGRAGVLGVDAARTQLTELERAIETGAADVVSKRAELAELESRAAALSTDQADLVAQVETSIRQNRELVVAAFITGGEAESRRLLASTRAADYQWQTYLLRTESAQVAGVADRLTTLKQQTDTEVFDVAVRLDSAKAQLAVAEQQLAQLEGDLPGARVALVVAEAWDFSDRAVARGRYGEASPEAWARLRLCESSGNYRAVNNTGIYRGAYQFDRQTWRTVGGYGDPINASALEQDARARALYALRGHQPWPVCGHHLS